MKIKNFFPPAIKMIINFYFKLQLFLEVSPISQTSQASSSISEAILNILTIYFSNMVPLIHLPKD